MCPLYTQDEFENTKHRSFLPLKCEKCLKTYQKTKKQIIKHLQNKSPKSNSQSYCSKECLSLARGWETFILSCTNCGKETKKTKSRFHKGKNHFCSQSCSSIFNNKIPNRNFLQLQGECEKCTKKISSTRKYCKECYQIYGKKKAQLGTNDINWWKNVTINEIQGINLYQKNATIRSISRRIYLKEHNNKQVCKNCGYDKHIEVCHINAIESFSWDTKISIVNDLNNLIGLCRCCHWELDRNLLTISDILNKSEKIEPIEYYI